MLLDGIMMQVFGEGGGWLVVEWLLCVVGVDVLLLGQILLDFVLVVVGDLGVLFVLSLLDLVIGKELYSIVDGLLI